MITKINNNEFLKKVLYAVILMFFVVPEMAGALPENCLQLIISSNTSNYNIRTAADAAGWGGQPVCLTINSGVLVGSTSTTFPALTTGSFPAGTSITIINNGSIIGAGGAGGAGGPKGAFNTTGAGAGNGTDGLRGGDAINLETSIFLDNTSGKILGGGGGGGGGAGYSCGIGAGCGGGGGAGGAGSVGGLGGAGGVGGVGGTGEKGSNGTISIGGGGGSAGKFSVNKCVNGAGGLNALPPGVSGDNGSNYTSGGFCTPTLGGIGGQSGSAIVYNGFAVLPVPTTGTISISSNIPSSWTITTPTPPNITGSGTSQTLSSQSTGIYTIVWGDVAGYTTPASQSLTLESAGTITFNGIYTALTCSNGAVNYSACTVNAGGQCINGTENPTTCDTCAPGFTFFNNSCVACTNGAVNYPTCTVNSSNQCINGANNPVGCTTCPTGQEFVADVCTPTAGYTVGDTYCDILAGENFTNSPVDCKPKAKFWQF